MWAPGDVLRASVTVVTGAKVVDQNHALHMLDIQFYFERIALDLARDRAD